MLHTVTLNPALDKTAIVKSFAVDVVNRVIEFREDPGGKGINVSKAAAKLGTDSLAHALLAGHTGKKIELQLKELGISVRSHEVSGETRTNLKIVDPEQGTNTDVNEPGPTVSPEAFNAFTAELLADVNDGDVVVIAGSLPRGVETDAYGVLTSSLRQRGAKVFLDAEGEPLRVALEARPHLIKPNDHELAGLVDHSFATVDDIAHAAQQLVGHGIEHVVVSMGGEGALLARSEQVLFARAPKIKVGSTVGAGDSMVAALAHAELTGMSPNEAARLAVATGSANAMCSGTQAADRTAIQALLEQVTIEQIA